MTTLTILGGAVYVKLNFSDPLPPTSQTIKEEIFFYVFRNGEKYLVSISFYVHSFKNFDLYLTSFGNRIAKCLSKDNATVINTDAHRDTLAKMSKNSLIRAKSAEK